MTERRPLVLTGSLIIAVPLLFNLCFALLQMNFDYPDILRQPAAEVLVRFSEGGRPLIALWYCFAASAALFLPAALTLGRSLSRDDSLAATFTTPLAVAATLTQVLGLIRWPLLVPSLAADYLAPAASEADRAATLAVFRAFHQYAGGAVGEHLGYLCTGAWTIAIGTLMLRSAIVRPWLGWCGIATAPLLLAGLLEPAGLAIAGPINAIGYLLWSSWLIATGITLLLTRQPLRREQPVAPAMVGA